MTQVWEFANSFRKLIGFAGESFGVESVVGGLARQPQKEDLTLVVQIHIALLSKLLRAGSKNDDDKDEDEGAFRVPKEIAEKQEKLKLAHEQLRKLPLTHVTWVEILRRFVDLSWESGKKDKKQAEDEDEDSSSEQDGESTENGAIAKEHSKSDDTITSTESSENAMVSSAIQELAAKEYETLSLSHKLALLEYLCYEVENTIGFRSHIKEQVDIVESLYKERWAEEQRLKKAKKALEGELQEKRKMQLLMMDVDELDATNPTNDNTKDAKKEIKPDVSSANGKSIDVPDPTEYVHFFSLLANLFKYVIIAPNHDVRCCKGKKKRTDCAD